ncbi:hypothetical protein A2716_00080 [candidate division WWE3 bacterium RIFCSPHIGHO2_01_FULL_40_23]|nr:MAG: hypothetical protein A2716_00080 [candidate division WWE3 bacterium RIFCSPHIGHO2_01_FULL_40_23]
MKNIKRMPINKGITISSGLIETSIASGRISRIEVDNKTPAAKLTNLSIKLSDHLFPVEIIKLPIRERNPLPNVSKIMDIKLPTNI